MFFLRYDDFESDEEAIGFNVAQTGQQNENQHLQQEITTQVPVHVEKNTTCKEVQTTHHDVDENTR